MSKNKVSFQNGTVAIETTLSFSQMAILESLLNNAVLDRITSGDSVSVQQGKDVVALAEELGLDINPTIDSLGCDGSDYDGES